MGKARRPPKSEYNDFLDGEKLRDNAEIRTTLGGAPATLAKDVSPPPSRRTTQSAQQGQGQGRGRGKGKGRNEGKAKKPPLTHFLCLPLVNEGSRDVLEKGLETLGKEVEQSGVVARKAVRPVGTLHLTLGVMGLGEEEEEVQGVGKCLEELDVRALLRAAEGGQNVEDRTGGDGTEEGGVALRSPVKDAAADEIRPLSIDLQCLMPMQKPQATSVLYAEPRDATERLYPFAAALKRQFTEKGFMVAEDRKLKLHATIVNTIYAKPPGRDRHKKGKQAGKKPEEETPERAEKNSGTPTAGSISTNEEKTTVPPDPSTAETEATAAEVPESRSKSWRLMDARELITNYREHIWAQDVKIDRVQVCKMGAKKILDDEGNVVDEKYEVVFEKTI